MNAKQRLLEFLSYLNIGQTKFEELTGMSNGYINNSKGSMGAKIIERIATKYPELNIDWLTTGNGEMLKHPQTIESENVHLVPRKAAYKKSDTVNVYDVEPTMGLISVYENKKNNIIDQLVIPNLPQSDGAVIARGDSMYPLIKSGAIVAFRRINNFDFFIPGEIYIIDFEIEGDNYTTLKYVQTTTDKDTVKLVSYNGNHSEMVIPKSAIRVMALVTAWVNYSAMR